MENLTINVWQETPSSPWFWEVWDEGEEKPVRSGISPTETTAITDASLALGELLTPEK